jgi:hypothetical protein
MHMRLNLTVPDEIYVALDELALLWELSVQGAAKRLIVEGLTKANEEELCFFEGLAPRTRSPRPGAGRKPDKITNDTIMEMKDWGMSQAAVAREVGCSQAHVSHLWKGVEGE